ncbi:MAG: DNA-formamidopyrimidine glycosylase family protein [Panacagrimonas sp.]
MPEFPDLTVYLECIEQQALGRTLRGLRVGNSFVLRSVVPKPGDLVGRRLIGTSRVGKRLVLRFEGGASAVVLLMILGRLHWKKLDAAIPKGSGLCAFDFESGSLLLTESGKQRRASLHLVADEAGLAAFDRGGLEIPDIDLQQFVERLRSGNHTLKRALTDPTLFAGIGNAYSDEILHRAKLSPFAQTRTLDDAGCERLFRATRNVLEEWTDRLREEAARSGWPPSVTAFRPEMAVHGRYGLLCPVCGSKVQRIVYSSNEANYCARCQTGGRLLADRALSRLLHDSWPRSIDEV